MTHAVPLPQKLKGTLTIFRPELPLAAGMCVVIGEVLVLGAFPPLRDALLGLALGFFLSASALIFNDYFDLDVDRVNAPQRPLPAGLLSVPEVIGLGIFSTLAGLAAAWAFSPLVLGLSFITWVVGFVYNWKLKAAGLWGNLCVSTSVGMTFLIGGLAVGDAYNPLVWGFGLLAFLFDLGEEIAADAMDAEGDKKRGSKSIAILYGRQTALRLAGAIFGLGIVLNLTPIVLGMVGLRYIIPVVFTDIAAVFFVTRLLKSQSRAEGLWAIRGLYISASLGLLVFLIGSFFS